jgi:hypothetical protein
MEYIIIDITLVSVWVTVLVVVLTICHDRKGK